MFGDGGIVAGNVGRDVIFTSSLMPCSSREDTVGGLQLSQQKLIVDWTWWLPK